MKITGATVVSFVSMFVIASATVADANLVVNGDFSLVVPTNGAGNGWTNSDNVGPGHFAAGGNPGGYYWLNNVGGTSAIDPTITQTVTGLTAGAQYYLAADYISKALSTNPASATDSFEVLLGGSVVFAAGPTATRLNDAVHTWSSFGVCFTATASAVSLALRAEAHNSDNDFAIDNVAIDAAPMCPPPPTPTPTPTLTPPATPTATATISGDHFTCYGIGTTQGATRFEGVPSVPGLDLIDRFGPLSSGPGIGTQRSYRFCAPTNKLGEDPTAPSHPEHLTRYQLTDAYHSTIGKQNVKVENQFNPEGIFFTVKLKQASHILVPTAKSFSATPPTPLPFLTDHFVCYKITRMKGMPKFQKRFDVPLEDQFGSLSVTVKVPPYLCAPVDKNGEDPTAPNHPGHLVCYGITVTGTKFARVLGAYTNNQFAQDQLDVKTPAQLCVPSLVTLVP